MAASSLGSNYAHPPVGSDQLRCFILQDEVRQVYRDPPDRLHYYDQVEAKREIYPSDRQRSSQAAQRVMEDFQRDRSEYTYGEYAALGLMYTASVGMQASLVFAGVPGAILTPFVATATDLLIDTLKEHMGKESPKQTIALSSARYYRDNHGDLSKLDLPPGDDLGQRRFDILFDSDHPFIDPVLERENKGGSEALRGSMINWLTHTPMSEMHQMVELGNQLSAQGVEIGRLDTQIVKVNQALLDFRDKTEEHLTNIDNNITHINGSLEKIGARVADHEDQIRRNAADNAENRGLILKNQKDIQFMQGSLFGKMDPTEQLEALNHGFFPDMPESERQDLREKIEAAETRRDLMKNMSKFANGAQDLLKIADNLNIPVPAKARRAVEAGTQAINVGLSFASGNYLGAVAGLTGMLSMGKKTVDVGGARHQQVMTALSGLARGQNAILENQDLLLKWNVRLDAGISHLIKGQELLFKQMATIDKKLNGIIKNQEVLFQNIVNIAKALEQHHRFMMEQFAGIINHLVIIRLEIRSIALEQMSNCLTAVKIMYGHPGYIKKENRFKDYPQLLDYYNNHSRRTLPDGLKALQTKLANSGTDTDGNFFLPAELDYSLQVGEQERSIRYFSDLTQFSLGFVNGRDKQGLFLASLLHPVARSYDLKEKLEKLKQVTPRRECLPKRLKEIFDPALNPQVVEMQKLIGRLYSPNVALQFAEYAFRFHYFLDLFTGDIGGELYTFGQLKERISQQGGVSLTGKRLLQDAIVRLDVAIAQQSLLSGDYLLENLLSLFKKERTGANLVLYDKMLEMFNENFMLVKNFVLHSFCSEIGDQSTAYSLAYHNENTPEPLQELLGAKWKFVRKDDKWHLKIGAYKNANALPIPTPQEIIAGEFLISDDVKRLLGMRQTLIEELLRYDFVKTRPLPYDQEIYMRALAASV